MSLVFFVSLSMRLLAQNNNSEDEFTNFREELWQEYDAFRKEINAEYIEFLSKAWKEYRLSQGKTPDDTPKPLSPVLSPEVKNKQDIIVEANALVDKPINKVSVEKENNEKDLFRDTFGEGNFLQLDYFGSKLKLSYQQRPFELATIAEHSVGNLWKDLADSRFPMLLADMIRYKKEMQMNDWAYFLLTKKVAARLSTLQSEDCRTVFQHFLLVQSGYDVRLARVDHFLVLLLPVREEVYARPYLTVDGKLYYVISDRNLKEYSSIFTYKLPKKLIQKAYLSLAIDRELLLPVQLKPFCIKAAGLEVKGEVNVNKIRFYKEYLSCELMVYARAVPEKRLSKQLLASLSEQLKGKPCRDVLNQLLSWVQKGFCYQTDGEQFGYEKPFFIEENFFYPASDCEDRAILFAYLVNHLLGRDVVLLDYPGHVATAVCLDGDDEHEIKGAYMQLKGKRYMVCDPTYMNAKVGMLMPSCRTKRPKVIRL